MEFFDFVLIHPRIFDGARVNQNKVEKFLKIFLELFRPKANFGAKEKVELQTFVLEGHPNGREWPSLFWNNTDFSGFDSGDIIDYILEKSVSSDGPRPSFFWYDIDKDL